MRMVAVCYGTAMDKLKDDAQAARPDIPAQSPLLNGLGKENGDLLLITNALLIGNIEFKQENNTWQQYRVSPLQQYPLQQWVWGN